MNRRKLLRQIGLSAASLWFGGTAGNRASPLSKFKLGITTDEVSQDLEIALKFAQEFDLKWVELRHLWNRYVTEVSLQDLKRARSLLAKYQIKVSVLDTSLYKCTLPGTKTVGQNKDDYPFQEQAALLKRAMERSELLETRFIRVFSFWRVENPEKVFD